MGTMTWIYSEWLTPPDRHGAALRGSLPPRPRLGLASGPSTRFFFGRDPAVPNAGQGGLSKRYHYPQTKDPRQA